MFKNFLIVFLCGLFSYGCASDYEQPEKTESISSPIYNGYRDTDPITNSVVQLVLNNNGLCSGVAISRNLVVTAYHCVGDVLIRNISCGSDAKDSMGDDFDASKIKVFTGEIPALTSPPQAYGLKFFHPESKKLCNNDIAFLILDRQIDVIPATIRKKPYVNSSETFKISGYGLNNLNMLGVSGNPYGVRLSMSNVPLSNHSLNEFWLQGGSLDQKEMRGGACNGDSGGPAFSESTKSVVGILSRGGDCNTNAVKMYSFIGSHLDLLNLAVNESGSSIFEEGSDVVLPNLNPQDSTKTKMTCSHSEGHETSIVELFFVFIVVVSFFRKFGLI